MTVIKVAHIFASKVSFNSGDYTIGIAYKQHFKEIILKNDNVLFTSLDARDKSLYNDKNINKLNNYDYILIGGGGLILPDTCPNLISCWQWIISKDNINKITKPIYVSSIGYNLFYNQNINMYIRENGHENKSRISIFKENITTLINKAEKFTLRHNGDVNKLIDIIGEEYRNKISYEMCKTVWYVNKYWKPKINKEDQKYIAIEIKDDRQWRRYHKIGIKKYYEYLLKMVKNHIQNNEKILYLSHDGSRSFYKFLIQNKINIPYLDNTCGNEQKILENYSKIHTIYCSAGHSQMMAYGLGIKIISLISHPKLKYFCDDIGDKNGIDINAL